MPTVSLQRMDSVNHTHQHHNYICILTIYRSWQFLHSSLLPFQTYQYLQYNTQMKINLRRSNYVVTHQVYVVCFLQETDPHIVEQPELICQHHFHQSVRFCKSSYSWYFASSFALSVSPFQEECCKLLEAGLVDTHEDSSMTIYYHLSTSCLIRGKYQHIISRSLSLSLPTITYLAGL